MTTKDENYFFCEWLLEKAKRDLKTITIGLEERSAGNRIVHTVKGIK